MNLKQTLAAALTVLALPAFAQDAGDALRYSFLSPQGTARSIGFGSALGSVGGDFTGLSVNPASIGIYRKSEFMVTPFLSVNGADATYQGEGNQDAGARFVVSNVGAVFTAVPKGRRYKNASWKAVSFGVGLNRMADFSRNYTYSGLNESNSASFVFEEDANSNFNNIDDNTRPAYLGYQSYLLDTFNGGFISVVNPSQTGGIRQTNSVNERGGINELVFSLGGNYQEKLMLGATVGIPLLRYIRERSYTEDDNSGDNNNDFANFTYNEYLKTTGAGLNLKLGAIYRPNEFVRFGAAIHTPTWYSMTDVSRTSITANTEGFGGTQNIEAPERQYDYNLTTPWRAILSATGFLGKNGFVSLDYEYVDYASTRFSFSGSADQQYERTINQNIRNTYQGASNIRGGLEIRLDQLALRAGAGYYGNPYQRTTNGGERIDLSAGIGFRFAHSFLDLGYVHRFYDNNEQPYTTGYSNVGAVPTAKLNNSINNVALTVGWKF